METRVSKLVEGAHRTSKDLELKIGSTSDLRRSPLSKGRKFSTTGTPTIEYFLYFYTGAPRSKNTRCSVTYPVVDRGRRCIY